MLLLYTKNIDLTISHCNKALYYYIEFIGQIGDENHSYLQLNSKDATLFISEGDALDMRTNIVISAFIQGRAISLETHQTELYKRYSNKYGQTIDE